MDAPTDTKSTDLVISWRSVAVIAAFGAAIFLVDLGPGWVLTYHESYFAEPAREMLRTGDWIVPRMAGVPSWQKPPLTHWMIAATMGLLRTEAEWAVRLPTLLCTILNAVFVAAVAARWHGDRVGRLAGLIQLTTFYGLFQGRLAEADMPLCASITGAMLALAVGTIDRERSSWLCRLGFFVAAGASFLIKGPFGLVLLGGTGLTFALSERRMAVVRFLFNPVGLLVLTILCVGWPIAAYRADPTVLEAWRVHNLDRFTGAYEGSKNPFFYAYIIPAILLPWTPLAIGGLIAGWKDRSRPHSLWRLMTCWMAVGLALICASAWKHKHYPIPVLPPLSVIAAYALDRYSRSARLGGRSPAALLACVMTAGGAIVSFARSDSTLVVILALLASLAGLGLLLTVRLRRTGHPDAALATLFGTIGGIVVLNQSFVMPRFDLYRPHAEMARRVNSRLAPGEVLYLVEVPHPQILFYLRPPFRRFDSWSDFALALPRDPDRDLPIVGSLNVIPQLSRLGSVTNLDRASARTPMTAVRLRPRSAGALVHR